MKKQKPLQWLDFPELPPVVEIQTGGFLSQWCCRCGERHIWHFSVRRGKRPEDDSVFISGFPDQTGSYLRRFYARTKRKVRKRRN